MKCNNTIFRAFTANTFFSLYFPILILNLPPKLSFLLSSFLEFILNPGLILICVVNRFFKSFNMTSKCSNSFLLKFAFIELSNIFILKQMGNYLETMVI